MYATAHASHPFPTLAPPALRRHPMHDGSPRTGPAVFLLVDPSSLAGLIGPVVSIESDAAERDPAPWLPSMFDASIVASVFGGLGLLATAPLASFRRSSGLAEYQG